MAACLQAIRTTTGVLEAAIAQAIPAGLSAEVADSLARQRCEQTPLLSAVTWALRQVCGNNKWPRQQPAEQRCG